MRQTFTPSFKDALLTSPFHTSSHRPSHNFRCIESVSATVSVSPEFNISMGEQGSGDGRDGLGPLVLFSCHQLTHIVLGGWGC